MTFEPYSTTDVPRASQPILAATEKSLGFVPNLYRVMAESPAALSSYQAIGRAQQLSALTDIEQQVVAVTVRIANGCEYCVAAHSTLAKGLKIDSATLSALRLNHPLPQQRLEALRQFTLSTLAHEGWTPDASIQTFLDAGFKRQHIFDVIALIAMKTLANYVNHIADPALDKAFADQAWHPPATGAPVAATYHY
ncbi:MAG: carboxymuconolactone decarboxylase family protein [Immundisolibacteraceae bacterium]|nr:carboxymuconolactone decarboxylase family protein [Immundisolibacteraceae bacterium]